MNLGPVSVCRMMTFVRFVGFVFFWWQQGERKLLIVIISSSIFPNNPKKISLFIITQSSIFHMYGVVTLFLEHVEVFTIRSSYIPPKSYFPQFQQPLDFFYMGFFVGFVSLKVIIASSNYWVVRIVTKWLTAAHIFGEVRKNYG